MTTQAVATRLVELYNQGKALEAEQELYADVVISHEMGDGKITQGKTAVMEKTKQAFEAAKTVHRSEATKFAVNNDSFLVVFEMDMEMHDGSRFAGTEHGFYKVRDGKVTEEYFFMH